MVCLHEGRNETTKVGRDLPFFMHTNLRVCTGLGDELASLGRAPQRTVLLGRLLYVCVAYPHCRSSLSAGEFLNAETSLRFQRERSVTLNCHSVRCSCLPLAPDASCGGVGWTLPRDGDLVTGAGEDRGGERHPDKTLTGAS